MDLQTLTDEELQNHKVEVLMECEQRENIRRIPEQIEGLARTYRAGGGDPAVLQEAISGGGAALAPGAE